MKQGLLILLAGLILSGCTAATPVQTRKLDQGLFTIDVPFLWRSQDNSWRKPNTIFAYGDGTGSTNHESVVVYRMVNVFREGDKFDETYCREYFRLANSETFYDDADTKVSLNNVVAPDPTKGNNCEIYYTWTAENQAPVTGVDFLVLQGTDLYVVEGTAIEGYSFETAKQSALSFRLK
jgi:hypothetical protein